jgi:hypothetical protein
MAKQDFGERVKELNRVKADLPEYEYHHRKESVAFSLLARHPEVRNW